MDDIEPESLKRDDSAGGEPGAMPEGPVLIEEADFRVEHGRYAVAANLVTHPLQFVEVG